MTTPEAEAERLRRFRLWEELRERAGQPRDEEVVLRGVDPSILHELRIYGGQSGFWRDSANLGHLTPDGVGVAVGFLSTEDAYSDEFTDECATYHYPDTDRGAWDRNDIQSMKHALQLQLPVFSVKPSLEDPNRRDVYFGWVGGWDDDAGIVYVDFGLDKPESPDASLDELEFNLRQQRTREERRMQRSRREPHFRFHVLQRYGPRCPLCKLEGERLLDAAHIRPVHLDGSDDPRNGLVLCPLHHRAFDLGFFSFQPDTLNLETFYDAYDPGRLKIVQTSLEDLDEPPHEEALAWHWTKWVDYHGR